MTERQEKALEELEKVGEEGVVTSNNTITDTLSIMSSKLQSNNLKLFKEYLEGNESNIKDYTTAIGYEYNLDLQLYKSDIEKEIIKVNPNTILKSIGVPENPMTSQMKRRSF